MESHSNENKLPTEGEYLLLKVVSVTDIGVFLEWGQPKDLFLPFAEQTSKLKVGDEVIIFTYRDKQDRISASMRLNRNKSKPPLDFNAGDEVDLMIAAKTDLGFKAIINGFHIGVLYKNEVFQELYYGQKIKGYIRQIRDDGKIDLTLRTTEGHKAAEGVDQKILELLKAKNGYLPIHSKTPPEVIYQLFGVSKKIFKIALGGLYKNRKIIIEDEGIRLTEEKTP